MLHSLISSRERQLVTMFAIQIFARRIVHEPRNNAITVRVIVFKRVLFVFTLKLLLEPFNPHNLSLLDDSIVVDVQTAEEVLGALWAILTLNRFIFFSQRWARGVAYTRSRKGPSANAFFQFSNADAPLVLQTRPIQ